MFPQLAQFTDLSLLLLRLMVAAIFVTSGWSHLRDPKGRAESIGMSPACTMFLGTAELADGRAHATCRYGSDTGHAGSYSSEGLRLAHRLLERKGIRLALRPDARPDESGHHLYGWRQVRALEVRLRSEHNHYREPTGR
jgi:hypothetical protein